MMNSSQMESCAQALDEAANFLEQLASKFPATFDELRVRYPLADELGGFACMLREHAKQPAASLNQQSAS